MLKWKEFQVIQIQFNGMDLLVEARITIVAKESGSLVSGTRLPVPIHWELITVFDLVTGERKTHELSRDPRLKREVKKLLTIF